MTARPATRPSAGSGRSPPPGRAAWLLLALTACEGGIPDPAGGVVPPPVLNSIPEEILVPGSRLILTGEGFLAPPAGETRVRLQSGAAALDWAPAAIAAEQLRLVVDGPTAAWLAAHPDPERRLRLTVRPADQPAAQAVERPARLSFAATLEPHLEAVALPDIVAPGARLRVLGAGLIADGEGRSFLALDGRFTPDDGGPVRPVEDARLPLVWRLDRASGEVLLRPGALGLAPGRFDGEARLVTVTAADQTWTSAPVALAFTQGPPRITGLSPNPVRRGQILRLRGAGFLQNDPQAETATVIRARGVFTPTGKAPEPGEFTFVAERTLDHTEVQLALRTVLDAQGEPVGLGARPGRFEGTLEVELYAGRERARSAPLPLSLEIGGPAQFVSLRFLPGFKDGLARFGLAAAEAELTARILAVCARDFAGLRVHFGLRPPTDWAEFVTVEIGGADPNGRDLFGLDNSPGKDVGNRILDELLGGLNAETAAEGAPGFGGIFVESFLALSPGHPLPVPIADPRFDAVFGPFSPELSRAGRPLAAGEALSPERAAALERALDALANLIGSTVTHEVGHALGLAAVEGDWHNPTDTDGGLMDRGVDRPFAERAALDGHPPARFLGPNRAYLEALFGP